MVVPLPSKQIMPGQNRYAPPTPRFGSDLINRVPSVWGNGTTAR